MNDPNQHIAEYLEYYCQLENPEFAILINGEWGSGKTYYVKKTLESILPKINPKREKKQQRESKYLYVSLYGLQDIDDVSAEFFKQLHPGLHGLNTILSGGFLSKGLALLAPGSSAGTLAKVAEDTINTKTVAENLKWFDTRDHILVFDDLERSSIDINTILGYINHQVIEHGNRAIIIANEGEIEKGCAEYKRIKEKLIGATFKVTPNIDSCLNSLNNQDYPFLDECRDVIKTTFRQGKFNNIRHILHALREFNRLYKNIENEILTKDDLLKELLRAYFALSIEIKSGDFTIANLKFKASDYLSKSKSSDKSYKKTLSNTLEEKYGANPTRLLSLETWKDIFEKNIIDPISVEKDLLHSHYFYDETTPSWKKLWDYSSLEDSEFTGLLTDFKNDLKAKKYTHPGEILHAFGLQLEFSQVGIIPTDTDHLPLEMKEYIEELIDNNKFFPQRDVSRPVNQFEWEDSWDGKGYHHSDLDEFKELEHFLNKKILETHDKAIDNNFQNLFNNISLEPAVFFDFFTPDSSNMQNIYLENILPKEFIETYLKIPNEHKREFERRFKDRYEAYAHNLIREYEWLKAIQKELKENKLPTLQPGPTKKSAERFLNYSIQSGIEELDAEKGRKNNIEQAQNKTSL